VTLGDVVVNRMGFGARWVDVTGPEVGAALLRRVLELGVNLIDTADVYGGDHGSERLIADALHPYPDDLVIATKGGQVVKDGQPAANGRPEYLRSACEGSLRRLRRETIDLYQLHMPDADVPLEESLGALVELRREGKIRHIGVSNFFGGLLDQALTVAPIVSVQNLYNLGRRRSDPEIDACERHGIAYMPWFPLFAGEVPETGELGRIAGERDATPAQVALAWLLARSPAMLPIPGTSSSSHLEENVAAASVRLTDEEVARLAGDTAP
jgi:aryl-alcohol dehydrogenase-like predicted oxidoreductase